MRLPAMSFKVLGTPQCIERAESLVSQYRSLPVARLAKIMQVSETKAAVVQQLYAQWSTKAADQVPAVDAFVGDIYSGLQVQMWSQDDRRYAHEHLVILSGLYGALRACDGIMPYRLEMGYKLPDGSSLYSFWGDAIASTLARDTTVIVNLSAVEYTKAVLPFVDKPIVSPKFLTISPKTNEPVFVTVHAKVARGAFARWMIQARIDKPEQLRQFTDLGYAYDEERSTDVQPVFVCREFGGIGLSVRLTK